MKLVWSISRDQILHTCERRYYFQYLAPARINSRNPLLKEIAFLRRVTNIPMWKGKIFHSIIAEYFKRRLQGYDIALNDVLTHYINQMGDQWNSSLKLVKKNLLTRQVNSYQQSDFILLEHLYQEDVSRNSLESAIQDMKDWIKRFAIWNGDENIDKLILKSSKIWIEPPTYGQEATGFEIDGIQVITKVDLAFLNSEGQFLIFDWKTSVPVNQPTYWITQPEFQAAVYQLWANLSLKILLNNISAHFIHFGNKPPEKRSFTMEENMKEYTISLIRQSISRMKYFHQQIHHDSLQLTLDRILRLTLDDLDFAYTEKSCIHCPFKGICRRELEV